MPEASSRPRRLFEIQLDGRAVQAPEGATILDACRRAGVDVPALCFLDGMKPFGGCRLCVVEVEGTKPLVAACERRVEPGMKVRTGTERVRHVRRIVLELLSSSADLSRSRGVREMMERYGARSGRFAPPPSPAPRVDNDCFVRDLSRCILCRRCVAACGSGAQHAFALGVTGRGSSTRVATEYDGSIRESACVYCGNCVAVCPTGALLFRSEHDLREAGKWDEARQTRVETVCPFCGVGCPVTLHVQDNAVVKVTSPRSSDVTRGHLCVRGRFGWSSAPADPRPRSE